MKIVHVKKFRICRYWNLKNRSCDVALRQLEFPTCLIDKKNCSHIFQTIFQFPSTHPNTYRANEQVKIGNITHTHQIRKRTTVLNYSLLRLPFSCVETGNGIDSRLAYVTEVKKGGKLGKSTRMCAHTLARKALALRKSANIWKFHMWNLMDASINRRITHVSREDRVLSAIRVCFRRRFKALNQL